VNEELFWNANSTLMRSRNRSSHGNRVPSSFEALPSTADGCGMRFFFQRSRYVHENRLIGTTEGRRCNSDCKGQMTECVVVSVVFAEPQMTQ